MRIERIILEHHRDVAFLGLDVVDYLVADRNRAGGDVFSSPASIRNKVDLPQPEGPTRTTNAPSSIGTLTPCRTSNPPNDFRTSRICTDAMRTLLIARPDGLGPPPAVFVERGHSRIFC